MKRLRDLQTGAETTNPRLFRRELPCKRHATYLVHLMDGASDISGLVSELVRSSNAAGGVGWLATNKGA
jgi:hypothetical protein